MHTWLAAPWQIALSAAVPVAIALLLFLLERRGPLAKIRQASKGLVPSYFTAVAVVFSLFAALLASDAWRKDTLARAAVEAEADAVRTIAYQARVAGVEADMLPRLKSYIASAGAEDPYSAQIEAARGKTDKILEELMTSAIRTPTLDNTSRSMLSSSMQSLVKAHNDRLHLATDVTAPMKWASIVVFGAITQVALLLVHIGDRRAQRVAVGLFTVAFSFCLIVVAIFDNPFETILADEPGATLGVALGNL